MKSNPLKSNGKERLRRSRDICPPRGSVLLPEIRLELEKRGLSTLDAVRLVLELADGAGSSRLHGLSLVKRCRSVISLGSEASRAARHSVSFAKAVESSTRERRGRRPRTLQEIRNVCSRLLHSVEGLSTRCIRHISAQECRLMIERVFPTPRQQAKARTILHAVFAHSLRQGWCDANPLSAMPKPCLLEREIEPLPWAVLRRLLRMARKPEHRSCMPALGLMLWAGVRPAEVERLCWEDIDWDEKVICVRPRHSKTGGTRHITLQPVLAAWLSDSGAPGRGRICPPDWLRRWKRLRDAAGAVPWQQDVLRHTFASYFIKQWNSFERLQVEMGHRSAQLLRTRYLSMKGVTRAHAALFWKEKGLW